MKQNDKYQNQLEVLIIELDGLIQTIGTPDVNENEFLRRTYLKRIEEIQKKVRDTKLKRIWDTGFVKNNKTQLSTRTELFSYNNEGLALVEK